MAANKRSHGRYRTYVRACVHSRRRSLDLDLSFLRACTRGGSRANSTSPCRKRVAAVALATARHDVVPEHARRHSLATREILRQRWRRACANAFPENSEIRLHFQERYVCMHARARVTVMTHFARNNFAALSARCPHALRHHAPLYRGVTI